MSAASTPPVALVTGASSGFGLLAAIELARAGHRVLASMRDPTRAGRLHEAARAAGVELETAKLDVTDEGSIAAAVEDAHRRAGRIDVLVNNAGFAFGGFLEDLSLAELREQHETNFFGLVAVTKAVIPGMRERRCGRVINLSSIAGRVATPGMSAYVSSKWAVEGLSESLRLELLPYGVYVVLVEPGSYKTDIWERGRRVAARALDAASPYHERSRQLERLVSRMLAANSADPADVARVIVRAATARRPRLRWVVGKDARREALAKAWLPSSWFERAVLRYVEVKGGKGS